MFEFLFKYPIPVFTKGRLVLLMAGMVLLLLVLASAAGLGRPIRLRLSEAAPKIQTWRAGVVWLLQSLLVALVLVLLWQPAITVAELKSQQNMIAVLVDDSRSMAIPDSGDNRKTTREAAAVNALGNERNAAYWPGSSDGSRLACTGLMAGSLASRRWTTCNRRRQRRTSTTD